MSGRFYLQSRFCEGFCEICLPKRLQAGGNNKQNLSVLPLMVRSLSLSLTDPFRTNHCLQPHIPKGFHCLARTAIGWLYDRATCILGTHLSDYNLFNHLCKPTWCESKICFVECFLCLSKLPEFWKAQNNIETQENVRRYESSKQKTIEWVPVSVPQRLPLCHLKVIVATDLVFWRPSHCTHHSTWRGFGRFTFWKSRPQGAVPAGWLPFSFVSPSSLFHLPMSMWLSCDHKNHHLIWSEI